MKAPGHNNLDWDVEERHGDHSWAQQPRGFEPCPGASVNLKADFALKEYDNKTSTFEHVPIFLHILPSHQNTGVWCKIERPDEGSVPYIRYCNMDQIIWGYIISKYKGSIVATWNLPYDVVGDTTILNDSYDGNNVNISLRLFVKLCLAYIAVLFLSFHCPSWCASHQDGEVVDIIEMCVDKVEDGKIMNWGFCTWSCTSICLGSSIDTRPILSLWSSQVLDIHNLDFI